MPAVTSRGRVVLAEDTHGVKYLARIAKEIALAIGQTESRHIGLGASLRIAVGGNQCVISRAVELVEELIASRGEAIPALLISGLGIGSVHDEGQYLSRSTSIVGLAILWVEQG